MIVADGPDIYGYTIFCDDIRVEAAGKLTYVGAYHGTMLVHGTFPFLLPRFALHFFYYQKRPNVIPPTKIIIVMPGTTEEEPFMAMEIPDGAAAAAVENAQQLANATGVTSGTYTSVASPVMLSNLVINEPGFIKVRAVRGEEFIRLGTLHVVPAPNFLAAAGQGHPIGLPEIGVAKEDQS